MLAALKRISSEVADALMPRLCPVCGQTLPAQVRHICPSCMAELPLTLMHLREFNAMEQLFAGKTPVERAAGYFYYDRESRYAAILHSIKYHNNPQLGRWLAARFAADLAASGFFEGIDLIVPVPLHFTKLASRGYNQSEHIARGMAQVAGLPVKKWLTANEPHSTQTRKGVHERLLNTQGIFKATHAGEMAGKHVLIVDDVVTTGATLLSCAQAVRDAAADVKISLATLAVARLS